MENNITIPFLYKYYCIFGLFSFKNLSESEFHGIVWKRDKLQDLNINQLKLEVHYTYTKDEKNDRLSTC